MKGQSAIEYMTTYGWAIIVIALGVISMFYFGIFNLNVPAGNNCLAISGYLCQVYILNTAGSLSFTLGYKSSQSITITEVACSNSSSVSPSAFSWTGVGTSQLLFGRTSSRMIVSCNLGGKNAIGSQFSGSIWIKYNEGGVTGLIERVGTVSIAPTQVPLPPSQQADRVSNSVIVTGSAYTTLAYNPATAYMYVAASGTNTIYAISGNSIVSQLRVNSPYSLAFDPDNNYMYAADYTGAAVNVISGNSIVGFIGVGAHPSRLAYDPSDGYMYVSEDSGIGVISGTTLVTTIASSSTPTSMAYDPIDGYMYVLNPSASSISIVSGTSIIGSIALSFVPNAIAYDPIDGYLYVSSPAAGTVSQIAANVVVKTISVAPGSTISALAYDPHNEDMYIAGQTSNSIYIMSSGSVIATVSVGGNPDFLAFDPINETMYVAGFGAVNVVGVCPTMPCI